MGACDRRVHDGRVLLTRGELARVSGERDRTLYKWYAARARNGHPDGVQLDGQLYFDEQDWREWRAGHCADRRVLHGRVAVSRIELARVSGEPLSTLARWYAERAHNAHPDGVRLDNRLYVDEQDWQRWYRSHHRALKARLTEVDRSGDPDELLTATAAARVLGYRTPGTLTGYVARGQFIEPDLIDTLPSGRQRRWWTRRRLWEFADRRAWSRASTDPATPSPGGPTGETPPIEPRPEPPPPRPPQG